MKKRQIGKLQIIIGILVLIMSLTGLLIANNWNKEQKRLNKDLTEDFFYSFKESKNSSNETKIMVAIDFTNKVERSYYSYTEKITSMILFSIIAFILSLMFLTQGLSNISKNQ